jgi:CheY-like chemotaxis protein
MGPSLTHILYVEDDPDIRMVAELALETVGQYVLRSCASGAAALAEVGAGYIPDLILLDVMMPEMDGPSTLLRLRELEALRSTPVVFMTAKVQASEVAYYKCLGACDVIAKPFDPMQLARKIAQIWDAAHA